MKNRRRFIQGLKKFFSAVIGIIFILAIFILFAFIIDLISKQVNYSPWGLLAFDILFVFMIGIFHKKFDKGSKRINKFLNLALSLFGFLGAVLSFRIALTHSWAMFNILVLMVLFIVTSMSLDKIHKLKKKRLL